MHYKPLILWWQRKYFLFFMGYNVGALTTIRGNLIFRIGAI